MPAAPTPTALPCRAMLLAAGRGERMRPLTDSCPKPLLQVQGKPLMQWPMEALAEGGFSELAVNTAWLGDRIETHFGREIGLQRPSGGRSVLSISYSREGHDFGRALETAGGIVRALPLLDEVFWVLAGDVFAPDFVFSQAAFERFAAGGRLAHLWLVPNPAHNPKGDFGLDAASGLALNQAEAKYTYSTIGLYRRALFEAPWCPIAAGNPEGLSAPLAPLLRAAMDRGLVSAERYEGRWTDVGTPERLAQLNRTPTLSTACIAAPPGGPGLPWGGPAEA